MIKKLILSTLIILGIVASTQAQTNSSFDFGCEVSIEESVSGFPAADLMMLEDAIITVQDFVVVQNDIIQESDADDSRLIQISFSLEYGPEDDAEQNVPTYRVMIDGMNHGEFNTLAKALIVARARG